MVEAAKVGGVCRTAGAHAGPGCDLGRRSWARGAGANRVGDPREACISTELCFVLGGLLHEGDGCSRGQKGCFRVSMKEGGSRMQFWRWGLAVGTG